MLGALKDLIVLVAAVVVVAHAGGKREWLWRQISLIHHSALVEVQRNWGCPSIFDKTACRRLSSH